MNSSFDLPPEEQVIRRNRAITAYYAQLYQKEPLLYKWTGMAAFASFHIGEKLQLWNWKNSGIKSFAVTCRKKNRTLEDDFQVIRVLNNKIFSEIGWVHLAFGRMDYQAFNSLLVEKGRHPIIIHAFEKLNNARMQLKRGGDSASVNNLIWEANVDILWHEQSEVVQPLFDKLSDLFSGAMTFFAGFDYQINHFPTSRKMRSRFILFMLINGFSLLRKDWSIPELTNLQHRWYWIRHDIIRKWQIVESKRGLINTEIEILARLEDRNLRI